MFSGMASVNVLGNVLGLMFLEIILDHENYELIMDETWRIINE